MPAKTPHRSPMQAFLAYFRRERPLSPDYLGAILAQTPAYPPESLIGML